MKDFLQILFAGALGALAAYFNVLLIPLCVLVAVMLVDYVTGMAAAWSQKTLNAVINGWITAEEYKIITGEVYGDDD